MLLDLWFCCENCYDKPKNCYDKPNEIKFLGPQKWGIFIGKGVRLIPRWVENKKQTFISNIKSDEVSHIKSELQMLTSDTAVVCWDDINNLTNRISNIFISSAQTSFTRKQNFIKTTEDKNGLGPTV